MPLNSPKEYLAFSSTVTHAMGKTLEKTKEMFEASYPFVKHIPDRAWLPLSQLAVQRWAKWPPNIVKAINELYGTWSRDSNLNGSTPISYNSDDDIRFPVALMQRAFKILDEKGWDAYHVYANAVGIPRTDRERIENKFNICRAHGVTPTLPEVGIRVNPKTDRPAIQPYREYV